MSPGNYSAKAVLCGLVPMHDFKKIRTHEDFERLAKHLDEFHGISRENASEELHRIKEQNGLGGANNVVFGRNGDVFERETGDNLGTLTRRGKGGNEKKS